MKTIIALFVCVASFGVLASGASTPADQLEKANLVINEIMQTPEKGIPQDLLGKAVCVGIVPAEIKVAFMVGGRYGRGVLVCRKHGDGPWGAPSLFTLGGGSFGFQLGGKETDVVFIVMNPGGIRRLLESKVTLGAGVSVAGGPVGRSASGETDAQMHAEILSYSRARGLFAGASLEGAVLTQDRDDNENLYGREVKPADILIQGAVRTPVSARALDRTLTRYSPNGGVAFEASETAGD